MLLRARTVLPLCSPPIDNGAVAVRGDRIESVGRFSARHDAYHGPVVDLGDVALLPGLINAHCHLDYTDMAGKLSPARNFSDWIKGIVSLKAEWSYGDFAQSWIRGAKMLLRSGTTTVVDIEAVPELLPEVLSTTSLRLLTCLELLSVRSRQSARQLVEAATGKLHALPGAGAGFSPHAPYSTTPELLRAAAAAAHQGGWLLTTHVAESADEFQMYARARGAMYQWLKPQRNMNDCGDCSPVAHLARHNMLSRNFLAVHANYLARDDAALLAESGASVVHCPRSHAFFDHRAFPVDDLERAGVKVCLGTDSLATTAKSRGEPLALDLFAEMRLFAKNHPARTPQRILEMVTLRAAAALAREEMLGALAPGLQADLIAVPVEPGGDVYESVLHHRGDVAASMIRGSWAILPR